MRRSLTFFIIFLLLFLILRGFWNFQFTPLSKDTETKSFIIQKGQSISQVADKLQQEKLIRSGWAFKLLVRLKNIDNIQAGTFKLSSSMSAEEIIKVLRGGPNDAWVTLLEGWRVEEMAEKLDQEFLKYAKEGYMFPDTYLFPKDYSSRQIAQVMMDNFEKKFTPDLKSKIRTNGLSEQEGVILASIVEREARSDKVRTEVASILLKRFKINMGLNADATIQYALGYQPEEKSWWKRHLTKEDLKIDSPFNTYLYRGLPPTPIANPGLSSLQAVANADPNTPYLYYYHDSKGIPHYGKTLEEHNQNVTNNP